MELSVFPELKTERLLLREIVADDQQKIFEGLSHPAVIKYYGVSFASFKETQEQMNWYKDLWISKTGIWLAICSLDNKVFYGACGLNNVQEGHKKGELGFWLLPAFWGRGIVPEAAMQVLNFGFNSLDLHRIEAYVEVGNINSKKALEKLAFGHEGTMVDAEIKNGKFISLEIYAKLKMK